MKPNKQTGYWARKKLQKLEGDRVTAGRDADIESNDAAQVMRWSSL